MFVLNQTMFGKKIKKMQQKMFHSSSNYGPILFRNAVTTYCFCMWIARFFGFGKMFTPMQYYTMMNFSAGVNYVIYTPEKKMTDAKTQNPIGIVGMLMVSIYSDYLKRAQSTKEACYASHLKWSIAMENSLQNSLIKQCFSLHK